MKVWALEHTAHPAGWVSALIGTIGLCVLSVVLAVGGLVIAALVPIAALVLIWSWRLRQGPLFVKVHFQESNMIVQRPSGAALIIPYTDVVEARRTFVKNYSGGGTGYALLIRFRCGTQGTKRILPGISDIAWADAMIEHIRSIRTGGLA